MHRRFPLRTIAVPALLGCASAPRSAPAAAARASWSPREQVLRGTAPFIRAVLDVLPRIDYYPMEIVRGCPVRELVKMPFVFSLSYQ